MRRANITVDLVSQLIVTQFPEWADLPIRPVDVDGWDNATFRLGDKMAVRLPSAEHYVEAVEKEHRWLPVLASQLPLPIPEPLAMGVAGCGYPWPWSVCRWIDGVPVTEQTVTDLPQFAAGLADFLTALYKIDPAGGPRRTPPSPRTSSRRSWPIIWPKRSNDAHSSAAGRQAHELILQRHSSPAGLQCASGLFSMQAR